MQQLARVTGAPLTVEPQQPERIRGLFGRVDPRGRGTCACLFFRGSRRRLTPRFRATPTRVTRRVTRYAENKSGRIAARVSRGGGEGGEIRGGGGGGGGDEPERRDDEAAEAEKPTTKESRRQRNAAVGGKRRATSPNPRGPRAGGEETTREETTTRAASGRAEWRAFERDLSVAERAVGQGGGGPVFALVERAVTALREDDGFSSTRLTSRRRDARASRRGPRVRARVRGALRTRDGAASQGARGFTVRGDEPGDGCWKARLTRRAQTQIHGNLRGGV